MLREIELLRLIDRLYQGAVDDTAWPDALNEVARVFIGDSAVLTLHDRRTHAMRVGLFTDTDPDFRRTFAGLMANPDMQVPFQAIAANVESGLLSDDMVDGFGPQYRRSRFHDEWLRPQQRHHFVAALLSPEASLLGGLFICRSRRHGPYDNTDLATLGLLRPHLLRALQVRQRLQAAEAVQASALAALDQLDQGVLLVDASATVLHANAAARLLLGAGDGLVATRGALGCEQADEAARLRRLVGAASTGATGGTLAVRRGSGLRPLSVLVAPLRGEPPQLAARATAILFVADPERITPAPCQHLRELYGLTSAEARTAGALLHADSLAEVAARLGISLATVRTLLQRSFDKTRTRRQAELVALTLAHRLPATPRNGAELGD